MVVMMKNKKYLFMLLASLIAFCLLFLAACQPPDIPSDEDPEVPDETVVSDGLLVSNGYFSNIGSANSSTKYLKSSVPGWTAVNGAKEINATGIVMGIIDLEINTFHENKTSLISDFNDYPGLGISTKYDEEKADWEDTKALVLGIPSTLDKGSIYFTSGEITIEKDAYYVLNIDVYTDLLKEASETKSGAAICLTDGVFAEYISIDTNKKWEKYNFYIKGNGFEDRKFKIQLWLGHGPENNGTTPNPHLASGVVLYDNVLLNKIEETEYNDIAEDIDIQETVYTDVEGVSNISTRLDLAYPDPALTQYSPYDATSKYSGSTMYYYSAKKGTTPNYNFIVGGNDLTSVDRENFPVYTTTKTDTFPVGVFDMAKFYSFVNDTPSNTYGTIYTSSGGFKAPAYDDFYKKVGNDWVFSLAGSNGLSGRLDDSSFDTNALLVYHPNYAISGAGYKSKSKLQIEKNTYYKLSVWVYVWIPEMTEPAQLTGDDLSDPVKVAAYEEKKAEYDRYYEYYNKDRDVSATFRVSGASVSQDSSLEAKSTGWGTWQELTVKIKGNELSERQLNFELWYGEGKWDSDTLYPGACLFDDIRISEYDDESIVDAGEDPDEYYQLSILQTGDFKYFGLIDNSPVSQNVFTTLEDTNTLWSHELVDQRTSTSSYSAGILGGLSGFIDFTDPSTITVEGLDGLTEGPKTISIKYNNVLTPHDVFMINHIQPTASSAKFIIEDDDISTEPNLQSLLLVNPNSFYRLSMWVKTAGIMKGKGASVSVFAGSSTSATAQYTGINSDEWIELVLYVQGRSVTSERLNIGVTLGSGDIFTPDSHLQGAFYMTAMTWQKITYEEHKNADTTQTNVKKQTLSETSGGTTSGITNGYFNNIETTNYDNTDLFDVDGNLVGTATPSSWNKTEAKTSLTKPNLKLSDNHSKLTWDAVDKATYYYVFMNKYSDGDETKDNVMIGRVAAPTTEYAISYNGSYYIRALGGTITQDKMFSATSSVVTATKIEGGSKPAKYEGTDKDIFNVNMGVVNYLYYEDFDAAQRSSMYGDPAQGYYKSTSSNNLLLISSELDTYTGYTMSSSHTVYKNKYYVISVWVRTLDGAKASITLKNPSSALALKEYADSNFEVNGEYIGFVNIDTAGEWVQYRMLINSTLADGRISIELFLGNQYAEEISSGEGEDEINYSQGLSRGTVLFDDVNIKELTTEEAYNLEAYGHINPSEVDESEWLQENKTDFPYTLLENTDYIGLLYKNKYVFKIMDFTVDSFDNYTDATDDFIGHVPGAYNHKDAQDSLTYTTPTEDAVPSMLYGVYSDKQLTEKVYEYLYESDFEEEQINSFLSTGTNGNGRYFLMLANIEDNGQYYEQKTGFEAEAGAYYEIKFWAKLLAEDGKNAEFRFIYGNDTTKWSTLNIVGDEMAEYKFYVYNEDTESAVSSNKISFHLGTNDGLVGGNNTKNFFKGILVVDDISITKMPAGETTETAYAQVGTESKYTFAAAEEEPTPEDPDPEEETEKPKVDPQIWLLIASIVIGAMLLVTIIVLIVRRIGKRMSKNKKVVIQSKVPASGIPAKKSEIKDKGRKELQDSDLDKFND